MYINDNDDISNATKNNWQKSLVNDFSNKLQRGANKRRSKKRFIPEEYKQYKPIIDIAYGYIDLGYNIKEILFSVSLNLTKNITNKFLEKDLKKWNISEDRIIQEFIEMEIPYKGDILGGIYQSLLTEGEKNKKGSYYTRDDIVKDQIDEFFKDGNKIIDPCCGTGQYLMNIDSTDPLNIWGMDLDPIAVNIARINLMIKYKNIEFEPNIFHQDALLLTEKSKIKNGTFDIVATNPPWGSKIIGEYEGYHIQSGEAFSYFIERGLKLLKPGGILTYILPESILNVQVHQDIRGIMLEKNIISISELGKVFTGVFTPAIRIDIKNEKSNSPITIYSNNRKYSINKELFIQNQYNIFSIHIEQSYKDIIDKVYSKDHLYLTNKNSDWALGIVTGSNSTFISSEQKEGYIPIYTGKEVAPYKLKSPKKYLLYNPKAYQQIAPLQKYTTTPKIVYKYISKKLIFALDEEGVFTLNSANIIIPELDYPIKVIVSLFNSDLYQMIFQKKFNSIKVLKSHIQALPLPILNNFEYNKIENLFDQVVQGNIEKTELDEYIYNLLTK